MKSTITFFLQLNPLIPWKIIVRREIIIIKIAFQIRANYEIKYLYYFITTTTTKMTSL